MDDLGTENIEKVNKYTTRKDKWKKIHEIAIEYGFKGIQLSNQVYNGELGLSLNDIPGFINDFRLTYHIGSLYNLNSAQDVNVYNKLLKKSLNIADLFGMEDVSFHPPFIGEKLRSKDLSKNYLREILEDWLPKYQNKGIFLSIETHVSTECFIFEGLKDYAKFVASFPGLGVLIDISHNFYDGYSENDIINILNKLKITGLHLSDSIVGAELSEGTHLPIGKGTIDFRKILSYYKDKDIYGALEIKGSSKAIFESSKKLQLYMLENPLS